MKAKTFFVLAMSFLIIASFVAAQTQFTRHKLAFFVPSVTKFDVAYYTGAGYAQNFTSNSTYPGNNTPANYIATTGDIMFNSSTGTVSNIDAFATGGTAGQTSDATCILQYTNKGTTAIAPLTINITSGGCQGSACNGLVGNNIVCGGGTVTVQANAGTQAGPYTQLTNVTTFQVSASLASGAMQKVCLQANFTTVNGGSSCYIDLLSAG